MPVLGWPCSPLSRTERRGSQQSTGAQNRRSPLRPLASDGRSDRPFALKPPKAPKGVVSCPLLLVSKDPAREPALRTALARRLALGEVQVKAGRGRTG